MGNITKQVIKASDVEIATGSFAMETGKSLLNKFSNIESSSISQTDQYLNISYTFGQESAEGSITETNHLMAMLSIAFNFHKPIVLRPDHFWLLICQGFAEHIKSNSKKLKSKILKIDNKAKISVRRDDFIKGRDNPWEEVFPEFTAKISKLLKGDLSKNILLQFSTTSVKEKVAFEIAFMDSMSNFFEYEVMSLCGIPEIEIQGTIEDYKKIITSLLEIKEYSLDWWVNKLVPIIEQIINTLEGNVDRSFWKSIFKENEESGGPEITGWITEFFPYIESKKYSKGIFGEKVKNEMIKNPMLNGGKGSYLKLGDFPCGISKVPFKWKYLNSKFNMNFISGFLGIRENADTNFLETEINWVISEGKR